MHMREQHIAFDSTALEPPRQAVNDQPTVTVPLRQQEPVVPGMLHEMPAGLHELLLQAGQRPSGDPEPATAAIATTTAAKHGAPAAS